MLWTGMPQKGIAVNHNNVVPRERSLTIQIPLPKIASPTPTDNHNCAGLNITRTAFFLT